MAANSKIARTGIACSLAFLGVACGSPDPPAGNERVKPAYNSNTGRLERITYDRNGDGRTDATIDMDATIVLRAEFDQNFDGTPDRWEHYAAGKAASGEPASTPSPSAATGARNGTVGGALEKVEISARPDGQVTRREHYEDGQLRSAEEDTDADGRVDKWETWERGTLRVVALDTSGRGTADRRLVYAADGQPRLEVDAAGTGTFTPVAADR